jgi:tRNA(adenine34) deaminase
MPSDEECMQKCLKLAQTASELGNIGVAAMIVDDSCDGKIIAEAGEELPRSSNDVTAHAEILAIRRACNEIQSKDLSAFELYTTAEPCWMCSYAIREAKLKRVVYGTPSEIIGGATSQHALLVLTGDEAPKHWAGPPTVVAGVLANECSRIREMSRK